MGGGQAVVGLCDILCAVAVMELCEIGLGGAGGGIARGGGIADRRWIKRRQDRARRYLLALVKGDGLDTPANPEAQIDLTNIDVAMQFQPRIRPARPQPKRPRRQRPGKHQHNRGQ